LNTAYAVGRDENGSIKYTPEVEAMGGVKKLFDNVKPGSCSEATRGFLSSLQMLDHREKEAFQG